MLALIHVNDVGRERSSQMRMWKPEGATAGGVARGAAGFGRPSTRHACAPPRRSSTHGSNPASAAAASHHSGRRSVRVAEEAARRPSGHTGTTTTSASTSAARPARAGPTAAGGR